MAKPKLLAITIHPQKGGGHKVTHQFASAPKYSGSTRDGGMSMDQPAGAEHSFAPGEHNALLQHIAGALALRAGTGQRGGAAGTGAGLGGPGGSLGGMPPGGQG